MKVNLSPRTLSAFTDSRAWEDHLYAKVLFQQIKLPISSTTPQHVYTIPTPFIQTPTISQNAVKSATSCLAPSTGFIHGTLDLVKISTSGTYSALVLPSSSIHPTLTTIVHGYPSEVRYSRLPHSPQKCVVMVLPLPALRALVLSVPRRTVGFSVGIRRLLLKPLPVR